MFLHKLVLKDFKCYRNCEINFSPTQNYIFGDNWQGKSTIADAIAFALLGTGAMPRKSAGLSYKVDDVIRKFPEKADACKVILSFSAVGNTYEVIREVNDNGYKKYCLKNFQTGKRISGLLDVDREIQRILNMDNKIFANVFFSDQDELRGILTATPEERRKFIERILGFEDLKERVEAGLSRSFSMLQDQITLFIRFQGLKESIKLIAELKVRIGMKREEIEGIQKEVDRLCKEGDPKKLEREGHKKWANATSESNKALREESSYATVVDELDKTISELTKKSKCPLCKQPLGKDYKKHLIKEVREERKKAKKELDRLTTRVKKCELDLSIAQRITEQYQEISEEVSILKTQIEEIKRSLNDDQNSLDELKSYEDLQDKKFKVIASLRADLNLLAKLKGAILDFRNQTRSTIKTEIEAATNFFVSQFHDEDFDAEITIGDDYSIGIELHGDKCTVQDLSGAARDIVAVGLRYAFTKIAASKTNFVLLDEPTRHMDKRNLDKLKEMFNRIRDMQLLIITVENEFMDAEGMKIVVTKKEDYTSEIVSM